jgi:hypothetical protein
LFDVPYKGLLQISESILSLQQDSCGQTSLIDQPCPHLFELQAVFVFSREWKLASSTLLAFLLTEERKSQPLFLPAFAFNKQRKLKTLRRDKKLSYNALKDNFVHPWTSFVFFLLKTKYKIFELCVETTAILFHNLAQKNFC